MKELNCNDENNKCMDCKEEFDRLYSNDKVYDVCEDCRHDYDNVGEWKVRVIY